MKAKTKGRLYSFIIFFALFVIVWLVLQFVFTELKTPWLGALTAALTTVIAPHRKIIKTQTGEQVQLKSILSKKVIIIKQSNQS
jgi:hypothetical protein